MNADGAACVTSLLQLCCRVGEMCRVPKFRDGKTRENKHVSMRHIFVGRQKSKGLRCGDAKDFKDAVTRGVPCPA